MDSHLYADRQTWQSQGFEGLANAEMKLQTRLTRETDPIKRKELAGKLEKVQAQLAAKRAIFSL